MKALKKFMSTEELAQQMVKRGLAVDDLSTVESALVNINYYRLSGYLHAFKKSGSDSYIDGLTWEKLKRIYNFDRKITRILMYALEDIEETLKTRFSYAITSEYPDDPIIYLKPTIYREYDPYLRFLHHFYIEKDNNRNLPFVKHHNDNYGGLLPMWVGIELLTMGNLHALYDNLSAKYQKKIAKTYNTGPRQMSSWIENLTYTRNHLAHYMRVYNFNFGRTPLKCKKHAQYNSVSNMIFDQIFIISCMYSDAREWNNYVIPEIEHILDEYDDAISLQGIGFPDNWQEILTR